MPPLLDPALHVTLRIALALLLLSAARHKLAAPAAFRDAIADYQLVPGWATTATAVALVAAELGIGAALLVPVPPHRLNPAKANRRAAATPTAPRARERRSSARQRTRIASSAAGASRRGSASRRRRIWSSCSCPIETTKNDASGRNWVP